MGNKKSRLRPEVITDLQKETAFTADEIREIYRQWRLDCLRNNKGRQLTMNHQEFQKMYADIFPDGNASRFVESVFRTFDYDKSGEVNFKEFITTLSIQLKGSMEEKLGWAFDLYDIAGNGVVTQSEALTIITELYDLEGVHTPFGHSVPPQKLVEHMFKRSDDPLQMSKETFVRLAGESRTIRRILEGVTEAATQPFVERRQSSGSYGLALRSAVHVPLERKRSAPHRKVSSTFDFERRRHSAQDITPLKPSPENITPLTPPPEEF